MTGLLIAMIIFGVLFILGLIFKWEEFNLVPIVLFLWLAFIYFGTLYRDNTKHERPYRSDYGIVIGKEAEPAGMGLNMWTLKFQYMPDRYKLILDMEDGRRKEMSIDAVGYMQTNIGDRVKYRY